MIKIISEISESILFVEKPVGMSVHNEPGQDLISVLGQQLSKKIYLIHRLDKETSGIVCVATDAKAAAEFSPLFQSRAIKKLYLALCRGQFKQLSGSIDISISDKAEGRRNPQGLATDRKDSKTEFKVKKSSPYFSLVEFQILSGRQHQIRKHCALINHPIVNDTRYNDEKYNSKIQNLYHVDRMMLHACEIEFEWKNQTHSIKSELPSDANINSFIP